MKVEARRAAIMQETMRIMTNMEQCITQSNLLEGCVMCLLGEKDHTWIEQAIIIEHVVKEGCVKLLLFRQHDTSHLKRLDNVEPAERG